MKDDILKYSHYGVIALVFVLLIVLFKILFKKEKGADEKDVDPVDQKTKRDSNISMAQAKQIANTQLNAMNRAGTHEDALFSSLKGVNKDGLKMVYSAFGKVKYFAGARSGAIGFEKDLFGWYLSELGSKDLNKMRDIWKSSGLRF